MRKILIVTPNYSERNGGAIVLHKLCDLINSLGREAYLMAYVDNFELNRYNYQTVLYKFFRKHLRDPWRRLKVNSQFHTPVVKKRPADIDLDNWIVIYPEITFGNPLGAKNVVRWLLNNPGSNSSRKDGVGDYYYGTGELYFRMGVWFHDFQHAGSTTSKSFLCVVHYPFELFNLNDVADERIGTAYCLRKGKSKQVVHDQRDSILIDGKRHRDIAQIFKRVKTFISYDSCTSFSWFAALCGCDSVVIPDPGVSEASWMPDPQNRLGVAYGFENLEHARETRPLLLERMRRTEVDSLRSVAEFLAEADRFFDDKQR